MSGNEPDEVGELSSGSLIAAMGGAFEPELFIDAALNGATAPQEWARRALRVIEEHLLSETGVLNGYETMLLDARGAVAYLLNEVIADEYRHHHILAELAKAVGSAMGRPGYSVSEIPAPQALTEDARLKLLEETRRFLDVERDDARSLEELLIDLRPSRTRTIWPLLVELMALDTQKHMRILGQIEAILSR